MFGLDVCLDPPGFDLHHAHKLVPRFFNLRLDVAFKERQHLFAGKLGVDGQAAIWKLDDGIGASVAVAGGGLYFEHVGRQKVRQQTFQAGFAKLSAQMRQLEHVVQIVDGVSQRSDFAQLLFRGFQMLLHFFELGKSFLDVLIEFLLNLIGDGEQLGVDAVANRIQALRRFLIEIFEFDFELRSRQRQRRGQFGARLAQIVRLLAPSAAQLGFHRSADFIESLGQTIGHALAQVSLGALQPSGHIDSGIVELLAQGLVQQRRLLGKIRDFSGLRRTRGPAKNGRTAVPEVLRSRRQVCLAGMSPS